MNNKDIISILNQIDNLSIPANAPQNATHEISDIDKDKDALKELLLGLSQEIQRVMDQSNLTQEGLCRLTGMSQSNISKIQNGKVIPRIETLQKIASATHTQLIISFENIEAEE